MASAKSIFGAVVGRFIFTEARVASVRDVGPRLRIAELAGDALRGVAWTPGDKVQVYLPGRGMRTYTPLRWDKERGETSFLLYVHSTTTPGAAWAAGLRAGDEVSFFGPRSSIRFPELSEPVVLFGDETSFAAGRALHDARRATCVFEVDDEAAAKSALDAIGLGGATVVARGAADAHLPDVAARIAEELAKDTRASLALTGKAQAIQLLRARLKASGSLRAGKTKAYWSVGKKGLD
ncbi:MAG: siderophore-interacting protein [Labilithrix sp.]|nr:siderophore-interacting protein [Labilithrix sp.]MCW5813195.1 siderophore-interacting protein [Labilithrix sp.]